MSVSKFAAAMKLFVVFLLCLSSVWTLRKVPNSAPVSGRIIGGTPAAAGQIPWTAAIHIDKPDGRFFCGGTIFREQWILTASQCLYEATSVTVQVGSTTLKGSDPNRVTQTSTTFFLHPEFNSETLNNDIALIKLDTPLTFNNYIKPPVIIDGRSPIFDGVHVIVSGWGQTSDSGDLNNELNFVDTTILDFDQCKLTYGDRLRPNMCCTGGSNLGFCYGDTGSPLTVISPIPNFNFTILVGVASFISANGCQSGDPNGYTRVDGYDSWIYETITDNTN